MNLIDLLKAALLGIVEGLTEFLPVSSTGHLIVVADWLNFGGERAKVFEVFIQLGAILAVVWIYRATLLRVAATAFTVPASRRFVVNLLIAFMPAALIGLLAHEWIKARLFDPIVVAIALIGGGVAILLIERARPRVRVERLDDLTPPGALAVGAAQVLSLIPGVSRSGATIMGGLIFGLSRKTAAEFSFFLAIPTMFAATAYDLYKNWALLRLEDLPVFAVGFVASFVAAMWAVRGFIKFISNHTFVGFAWYRIVFGLIVLATWYFGWVEWSEP